jgi:hypothetical protein
MGGGGGLLGGITGALFGSPSQPATPDYAGAAQQTAQGNLDAARAATAANRVNQVTPYGSLSYAETGSDKYGNPTWTATTGLSPEMQQLFNYDTQSAIGLGKLQNTGLNYVQNMLASPFDTSGMTQYRGDIQSPTYNQVGQGPQFSALGQAEAMQRAGGTEQLQRDLENQGMAGWDKATGLLMERLNPSLERQQRSLDTQLANQGIMRGSEAYNQAQQDLAQKQNDLRTQAALGGQQVQQNLFGQALQAGQFGNQAMTQQQQNQLANLGFTNTAAQQDYANRQAMINQQNTIGQQGYQNQLAAQQANNAAMSQGFGNELAAAQLANQARGQQFSEAGYLRNEPINTLNAIRAGSQVTGPQFQNVPLQATTAGADYMGAAGLTGQAALANANAENAQRNATMQGLFSLGGSAMMSDIRTKENIKHLGYLPNGLPFYEFEYKPEFKSFGGEGKHVGVMAQEVEQVLPHAVIEINGYKVVNYGALQ